MRSLIDLLDVGTSNTAVYGTVAEREAHSRGAQASHAVPTPFDIFMRIKFRAGESRIETMIRSWFGQPSVAALRRQFIAIGGDEKSCEHLWQSL